MLCLMLFHLLFILGVVSVNVLVYCWFMFGLFLIQFGLDWIGFNSFGGGLVYTYSKLCWVGSWCMFGVCLFMLSVYSVYAWVYVWCMFGLCLVSVWFMFGVCLI